MLDRDTLRSFAQALDTAERNREPIGIFSHSHPGITIDDAYAIQGEWMRIKRANGRTVIGHKIGLTSKAMQDAVGIDEPDYGVLLDDMLEHDGASIDTSRFRQPRLEVELAFILDRPLSGPNCTLFDALDATRYVVPALEILDARLYRTDPVTGAGRKVMDTISDNAANAALVLGARPFRPHEVDLRWIAALLFCNGRISETGVAAGVLGHPALGVAWLANRLAQYGESLAAGEIVLAGSFTRPIDIAKGDVIHADYGPCGSVSCRFA
ncbi:2-hydroxyhexa-2,4-dienoate hydratase [Pigmentiphaga humi]|uniref:2-hydroxyhexa-2,4-dienoate hydratase n=1 Tax=Pigmentiphaga humi TaxID=2478468 RepID=A0A3P4B929_9BURK|nr:2-oxo-hepta-3-ene-1,7-dioic acid hydratase [Pigmentiphaga humi]VCU71655.1 2-hydroxyhexa-2,4-dienoate hydratase [Pigmentiphaga humi]